MFCDFFCCWLLWRTDRTPSSPSDSRGPMPPHLWQSEPPVSFKSLGLITKDPSLSGPPRTYSQPAKLAKHCAWAQHHRHTCACLLTSSVICGRRVPVCFNEVQTMELTSWLILRASKALRTAHPRSSSPRSLLMDSSQDAAVSTVVEFTNCTRDAATATLAAFANGDALARAIEWLTSHDGQPPPTGPPAPALTAIA